MHAPYGRIGIVAPVSIRPFLPHLDLNGVDPGALPPGMGGTPVIHLATEFLARGYPVSIYTLDMSLKEPLVLKGKLLHFYSGPNRPHGWKALDFFRRERAQLERFIAADQPDCLHAHWTYEFALAALAFKKPTLITAHDAPFSVLRFDHHPYRILRTCMALQVARRALSMTAVSAEVALHWQHRMGFRGAMSVVPNGLPSSFFDRGRRRLALSPLGKDVTYACVLVGWGGRKNGSVAIKAFAEVRKHLPNAKLILFGTGHGRGGPGEQWAMKEDFTAGVEFAGAVAYDELAERLECEVDVFVHPALEEALCMSVAEAVSMALPVIADENTSGMPYLLNEGRAGVLVDMRSPTNLAEEMLRLGRSASLRRTYQEGAFEHALGRLTIAAVADGYEDAYRDALRHVR